MKRLGDENLLRFYRNLFDNPKFGRKDLQRMLRTNLAGGRMKKARGNYAATT